MNSVFLRARNSTLYAIIEDPERIAETQMEPSMTDKEILDILRKEKRYLSENFGLLSIGLFGSYAKGSQRADSDIDVLVELAEPRFDYLAGLQIYLEDRLGKPVEVIRNREGLSRRFLRRIERSIHYA